MILYVSDVTCLQKIVPLMVSVLAHPQRSGGPPRPAARQKRGTQLIRKTPVLRTVDSALAPSERQRSSLFFASPLGRCSSCPPTISHSCRLHPGAGCSAPCEGFAPRPWLLRFRSATGGGWLVVLMAPPGAHCQGQAALRAVALPPLTAAPIRSSWAGKGAQAPPWRGTPSTNLITCG